MVLLFASSLVLLSWKPGAIVAVVIALRVVVEVVPDVIVTMSRAVKELNEDGMKKKKFETRLMMSGIYIVVLIVMRWYR